MKKFAALVCLLQLASPALMAGAPPSGDDFDRLDGSGTSSEKVNVIEWEGNLEVHVYPGGSLAGLALKLDKRNQSKPVMVIGYRFKNNPSQQLIRRAILGIDLHDGFRAYRDPSSGSEYDKIVISNNGLGSDMMAYRLDPTPTQLYPDGHPALANGPDGGPNGWQPGQQAGAAAPDSYGREPASPQRGGQTPYYQDQPAAQYDDGGTIQPFFMRAGGTQNRK